MSVAALGARCSALGIALLTTLACGDRAAAGVTRRASAADTTKVVTPPARPTFTPPARCAQAPPTDTTHLATADTLGQAPPSSEQRAPSPAVLAGSLFPGCRVVAYYGNPLSKRMGILGEIAPERMLERLAKQADAYAALDTTHPVIPALELIATVAQASPGKGGMYRLRMSDTLIEKVARWAEEKNYLLILDLQVGRSTVAEELQPVMKYLARPYVHLALDPEFAVSRKRVPGKVIGTLDAKDVNLAARTLAQLVDSLHLPPKMLIVHRFTRPMLTNHQKIELDPRVQIVIDMDGFGPPHLKYGSYKAYVHDRPVQFAGFKVFYKNDRPMLTPAQVLKLNPVPVFIMYQ